MKIKETIVWGAKQLKFSTTPRLDAELILVFVLNEPKTKIYQRLNEPLASTSEKTYYKFIAERAEGKPIAYIVGKKSFYNLDFQVNNQTLIPRPETEALVEKAINIAKHKNIKKIYDIGTGSGNIAIAIAKNTPNIKIIANDICKRALSVAKQNILNHKLENRIELVQSSLVEDIKVAELIVANLPYVPDHYKVSKDILFEPKKALFAGTDGLDLYKKMFQQKLFNTFRGIVLIEFGYKQYKPMVDFLTQLFPNIKITPINNIDGTICGLEADFS